MRKLFAVLAFMILPTIASAETLSIAVGNRWRDLDGIKLQQEKELVFIGRLALPAKGAIKFVVEAERTARQEPNFKGFIGVQLGF